MTDKYIPQVGDWFYAENPASPDVKYIARMTNFSYSWPDEPEGPCTIVTSIDDRPALGTLGTFSPTYFTFTKLPAPHNPENLSQEQLEAKDGWRFLDEDEVGEDVATIAFKEIEYWDSYWNNSQWAGNDKYYTYRTKLTRVQLRNLRNPNQTNTDMPQTTSTLRHLGNFSFVSGELAMLVALWLSDQGYTITHQLTFDNLCSDRSRSPQFYDQGNRIIGLWKWDKHETNHFTSFEAFRTWYSTPPAPPIPDFGDYKVIVTKTGVRVGCTEVYFKRYDEIVAAIEKARESDIPF